MQKITLKAVTENIEVLTDYVNRILEENDCPMKVQVQIDIAIDEIFSNIVNYAYLDQQGTVTTVIDVNQEKKRIEIAFIDEGIQYNPLDTKEPDITLSLEDREIGGLGIYMVKKSMDSMEYEFIDHKNHFKIRKQF